MAPLAEKYLDGLELILGGTYDIAAEALAISILDPTWTPMGIDATGLTFDASAITEVLHTINITSQAWTWDADTRTLALVPTGTISYNVGTGTEDFRYAVLHDQDNAHPPFVLITWPITVTAAATEDPQTFPFDSLMSFRLFSDAQPAPQSNVYTPVVLQDSNGFYWRVTALASTLGTLATTEADDRDVYLTSPDAATHLLSVSTSGVVTAAVAGSTPTAGARIFDTARPCLLPSEDPAVQHILTCSNAGTLTVT